MEEHPIQKLPSTRPANAAWNIERLCEKWESMIYRQKKDITVVGIAFTKYKDVTYRSNKAGQFWRGKWEYG